MLLYGDFEEDDERDGGHSIYLARPACPNDLIGDFEKVLAADALEVFVRATQMSVCTSQQNGVLPSLMYVRQGFGSGGKLRPRIEVLLILAELFTRIYIFRHFGGKVGVHGYTP